jgi:hypothetical protein
MTPIRFAIVTSLALIAIAAVAQDGERSLVTQTLVHADSKADVIPDATAIKLQLNSKATPLNSLVPVKPSAVQIALLIDDGLSRGAGIQLEDLKSFIATLPPSTELLVGYMRSGSVQVAAPFSTDHAAAASALRLPMGVPGESASPYFCLSDFVKKWPGAEPADPNAAPTIDRGPAAAPQHKARFVLMISNGVDPYNGSTSIMNQDSPYVSTAVSDAQRAGVAVYSIYYSDAGMRGQSAALSGQSYLAQLSEATGGANYFEGTGNPVSMAPFLTQFQHALASTYIAAFDAPAGKDPAHDLVRIKLTAATKTKLHAPEEVLPGNSE